MTAVNQQRIPWWARLAMPSLADLIFLSIFLAFAIGPLGALLLADADTGWHIRNGEHILATGTIPRADYFSYTRAGQPWFAWEWLYDVALAALHHVGGLTAVALLSATVIALTFALLYRLVARRSDNVIVAVALTSAAAAASSIHFLARPHLATWLFVVIWLTVLERYQAGQERVLWALPFLTVLWANLHGGFVLGLVLVALYAMAAGYEAVFGGPAQRGSSRRALHLAMVLAACLTATLVNPYGYRLHQHVFGYLSDGFLMDHIVEFLSPNFHSAGVKVFEALLLACVVTLALSRKRPRPLDVLMVVFAAHIALYAARNIPIAAMLLSLTIAACAQFPSAFSRRMMAVDSQLHSHLAPALLALALFAAALGHRLPQRMLLRFDPHRYPVAAADFLAGRQVDEIFSTDGWSAYLIYRLHPQTRVFIDDRHDFYGARFLQEYSRAIEVQSGWDQVLRRNGVNWVLLSPESALANILKESGAWRVAYDDGTAIVFARIQPLNLNLAQAK